MYSQNFILDYVAGLGRFFEFVRNTLFWATKPPFFFSETIKGMRILVLECLLPVISVVGPIGMVIALQGMIIIDNFGTQRLLSGLLAESMFRELSPILSSIMIAAQAGSSIAGEIGTMRVKEEIDALEVMAVNPFQFIILPKMLSLALICPLLNIIASIFGIFGGYFVSVTLKGLNHGAFMDNIFSFVQMSDIWGGIFKSALFGILIALISCYRGYNVTGGALGVGKAANQTVVHSVLMVVTVNYFVTSALVSLGI